MLRQQKPMALRTVRVDKAHIGYLRWCLESHDGLATPTTRDSDPNIIDFMVAPDFEDEFDELLDALEVELNLTRLTATTKAPM